MTRKGVAELVNANVADGGLAPETAEIFKSAVIEKAKLESTAGELFKSEVPLYARLEEKPGDVSKAGDSAKAGCESKTAESSKAVVTGKLLLAGKTRDGVATGEGDTVGEGCHKSAREYAKSRQPLTKRLSTTSVDCVFRDTRPRNL
jgi:hypothetical protein